MLKPRIRRRHRGDWIVDFGTIDGRRRRFTAPTEQEAKIKATQKTLLLERSGSVALDLSSKELQEAISCFAIVASVPNTSLTDMVDFYMIHKGSTLRDVTVSQVHNDQIISQVKKGLRSKSIQSSKNTIKGFVSSYADIHIASVTSDDIESWIDSRYFKSSVTQNNAIRYLSGLFSYAIKKGVLVRNPVDSIDRPKIIFKMPEFISASNVAKIMNYAISHDGHEGIVPKFALGFFAGIRPDELERLDWSDIKWADKIITIRPEVAKCGIARHVTMSDNIFQWLISYRRRSGLIGLRKKQFRVKRVNICKECGISEWPHDAMRHTFATFHFSMFQDAGKTSMELGHSGDSRILYRHYRGLATKAEAEAFYKIKPVAYGNVIRMTA